MRIGFGYDVHQLLVINEEAERQKEMKYQPEVPEGTKRRPKRYRCGSMRSQYPRVSLFNLVGASQGAVVPRSWRTST